MWMSTFGLNLKLVHDQLSSQIIQEVISSEAGIPLRVQRPGSRASPEDRAAYFEAHGFLRENAWNAADHLIWSMLLRKDSLKAYAVSHSGDKCELYPSVLRPVTFCNLTHLGCEDESLPGGTFGLGLFSTSIWHERFTKHHVFQRWRASAQLRASRQNVLDRELGIIDLSVLRARASALYELEVARKRAIELGEPTEHFEAQMPDPSVVALLEHYKPIEGWAVVLEGPTDPKEYRALVDEEMLRSEGPDRTASIKDTILRVASSQPELTKEGIRLAFFPELGPRPFDRHWRLAAAEMPLISKAGRRRRKS